MSVDDGGSDAVAMRRNGEAKIDVGDAREGRRSGPTKISPDEARRAVELAEAVLRKRFDGSLNSQDCEELASEACLQMLVAAKRGAEVKSSTTYTCSIAIRLAARSVASDGDRRALLWDPDAAEQVFIDQERDPERRLLARADLARLLEGLEQLAPAERLVWELHVVEGRSAAAVARRLGCHRRTVYKRFGALTAKLSAAIDAPGLSAKTRELLSGYVDGRATALERRRAERLIAGEPIAKAYVSELRRLHDAASAVIPIAGAIDQVGDISIAERLGAVAARAKERLFGGGEADGLEVVATHAAAFGGARGAGAAGAGVLAKVGLAGGAGKAALACLSGATAATVCVAAGVLPAPGLPGLGGSDKEQAETQTLNEQSVEADPAPVAPNLPTQVGNEASQVEAQASPAPAPQQQGPTEDSPEPAEPVDPLAPSAPPVEREFGVASAAAPLPASDGSSSSGSSDGGGASGSVVRQEFGP